MTTLGQVLANRENALLSTGPRTDEGKARAAQNSRTHGLCALVVAVKCEDAAGYASFEEAYLKDLDPQTVAQMELAERIVGMVWKARRAEMLETALWNSGGGSLEDMAVMLGTHARELGLILRYAGQNTRLLAAAREEYRKMQAAEERRAAAVKAQQAAEKEAAEKLEALRKLHREEDFWVHEKAQRAGQLAAFRAKLKAIDENKLEQETDMLTAQAFQIAFGEQIFKERQRLGRRVARLMADSYYIEEEGQSPDEHGPRMNTDKRG